MDTIAITPLPLIAGIIGAPLLGNALGRTFIQEKAEIRTQAEANAEFRRLVRNFAIFNAVLTAGMGYAAYKGGLNTNLRSAALGGAIGTGLLTATLTAALLAGPQIQQTPAAAQLGVGTGAAAGWTSNILAPVVGYTR